MQPHSWRLELRRQRRQSVAAISRNRSKMPIASSSSAYWTEYKVQYLVLRPTSNKRSAWLLQSLLGKTSDMTCVNKNFKHEEWKLYDCWNLLRLLKNHKSFEPPPLSVASVSDDRVGTEVATTEATLDDNSRKETKATFAGFLHSQRFHRWRRWLTWPRNQMAQQH